MPSDPQSSRRLRAKVNEFLSSLAEEKISSVMITLHTDAAYFSEAEETRHFLAPKGNAYYQDFSISSPVKNRITLLRIDPPADPR